MGNGPTKEEKLITEIATKETLLECPVLLDLDHGTIRHRHQEQFGNPDENEKVKVGYFYHPRLHDFSEDSIMTQVEHNRLKYVFKGPSKDTGKKLYYIYGTSTTDKDKGINHTEYKPQGKGYNWPQSYRKANNLYYDIFFPVDDSSEQDTVKYMYIGDDDENSTLEVESTTDINANISKENIKILVGCTETVGGVIERVSLQLLIPSTNIHLLFDKNEIISSEILGDFRPADSRNQSSFTVLFRLT